MTQDAKRIIDLFEFELAGGFYRYHNSKTEDRIINGHTWYALPIQRESVDNPGGDTPDPLLRIAIYADSEIMIEYNILQEYPKCNVYTYDETDNVTTLEFSGFITDIEEEIRNRGDRMEHTAMMEVNSIFAHELQSEIPRFVYAPLCQIPLYSTRCGVDPRLYTLTTTITGIQDDGVRINTAMTSPRTTADGLVSSGYFKGGVMQHTSTGIRRNIRTHYTRGRYDLTHPLPLTRIRVGDAITIERGCAHTITDCRTFRRRGASSVGSQGNIRNFRGFTDIETDTFRERIFYSPPPPEV